MKRTPLAIAVAVATLHSGFAAAQLEEVIVTAQRKDELLTEAPVAVSVISARQIEEFSVFQADELGKLTAGLDIRFEGDSNVGVGLRGVGTFSQQAAPARVGTYMDDYYMASQASFALSSLYDMANVQVLRGPQGTLYGQPSPTGAMILTTANPDLEQMTGYVQGSAVDPSGYNLQGAISVPLIENELAVRFAGLVDKRESGIENITSGNKDERGRSGFRVKALWEPSDTFSASVGYHYNEVDKSDTERILETIDPDNAAFDLEPKDRTALADFDSLMIDRKDQFFTAKLDWQIGAVDVSWFSGKLKSESSSQNDNDKYEEPLQTLRLDSVYGDDFNDSWQHELRVSSVAFDRWEWTAGAYYSKAAAQTDVAVDRYIAPSGVFALNLNIPTGTKTSAIFTHNSIELTEATTLTIGARYNIFESTSENRISGDFLIGAEILPGGEVTEPSLVFEGVFPCIDGSSGSLENPCVLGAEDKQKEWTGTIKLAHQFSDALNVYGTLDRGYRPGAPNFDTTGVFQPDLNNYFGESVNSFELGAKGDLFEGRARYGAAFFYSLYEDYQTQVSFEAYNITNGEVETPTNRPYVNVAEAEQLGIEGDFKMLITDNWSFFAAATWAQVEFTDGEVPCTDPTQPLVGPDNRYNTCDAKGENASPQPEFFGTLQSEYVFPELMAGADAYVNGLIVYRGETEVPGDSTSRFKTDAYTTLDFYSGLRSDTWSVQLFVKNATDEDGVVEKRAVEELYNELTMVPPRTYGITAGYRF